MTQEMAEYVEEQVPIKMKGEAEMDDRINL